MMKKMLALVLAACLCLALLAGCGSNNTPAASGSTSGTEAAGRVAIKKIDQAADHLYTEDGKLASIGYCYECYGIIVNPDLLAQAGHSVDEITNFETLKTVV